MSSAAAEQSEERGTAGRKRCSSEQDEEELGERKKSRPLRCKCNFTAEDVEDIASNEYLETLSLLSSLAWEHPSKFVGNSIATSKWDTALLPQLFYTDDPGLGDEGGVREEGGVMGEGWEEGRVKREPGEGDDAEWEIQEESLDLITQAPLWTTRSPEVLDYLPPGTANAPGHSLPALGFNFPPLMSRHIELLVHNHWETWKREGLIKDSSDPEAQARFHSIVTDAHIYLVNLLEAYIKRRSDASRARYEALTAIRRAVQDVASRDDKELRDDFKPGEQGPGPSS